MQNLVTIWSFPYQHQMLIIRGRLEAEGIETFVQDELTIQIDPLYSNALGGIKLMVQQQDAERANEILAESGYVRKEEGLERELQARLYAYSEKLPFVGELKFETRMLVVVPLVILLLTTALFLLLKN